MSEYPKVDYPTILEGVIHGDVIRMESGDGDQRYFAPMDILQSVGAQASDKWTYAKGVFTLKNFGPILFNGKMWGVTHLQYKSRYGKLSASPECFHHWAWLRMKKFDAQGNPIPGSELGLYIRKGFALFNWNCWRWDVAGTVIAGILRHWIASSGFFGGHWD